MAPSFSKPETVLKQAESLLSVNQPHAALQILSEMFTSKRFRSTPVTSLEPIMIRFMELCVELRKGRAAKEGLMQFKNLAQNTNVGSVEVVVGSFVGMAEGKVREEKEEKEKEGEVVDDVEDLEAPSTPESILLSSVSSSSSTTPTDRTSRTLLTPALKFLWETYRTSLETLKNNARLELIYQSVAKKAFRFCLENGRKTEFRRLCEMLRMHLVNVGKDSGNQINLGDAETLERHLETRFGQLNVSVELELWQEAFRSIEDIHNLLTIAASSTPTSSSSSTLTSTTPGAQNAATTTTTTAGSTSLTIKSTMIANYYEKLSQVFLMSGNALYHAAAWAKYYELLTVGSEHTLKHDQRSILAGKVVVSALAVPITAGGANEVHPRLSALLNLPEPSSHSSSSISTSSTAPTRTSLLASLLSSDILPLAPKTVQDLYRALQVEFDPLGLAENVGPLLRELAGQGRWTNKEIYGRYIPLLHDAVLDRLLRGLGEVYSEVRIEDVVRMVSPLERGFGGVGGETGKKTLESYIDSYIVSLAKKGEMGIRIDHREHAILFIDEGLALGSDEAHAASSYLPSSFPAFSSIESNASGSVQPSPTSLVRTRLSAVAGCLDVASRALGVVQRARLQDASTSSEAHAQSEEFPSVETLIAYRKSLLLHQSLTFRRRQLNQELQARAQAQSMSVAAENARR
ncbi:eukaryotic translation initiation factor-like protein 3, partial [Lentinula raphanica]